MIATGLDRAELVRLLDLHRRSSALSWRDVAREVSVQPSTLTRMRQGGAPDADALVRILDWLGVGLDAVVKRSKR